MSSRREFFKKGILAGAGIAILSKSIGSEINPIGISESLSPSPDGDFTLPALPYAYDALEPFIDKQTMEIHHTKHHQAYVDKLNKALADAKITGVSLEDLCKNASKYPVGVKNNAGGHYNHSLFWKLMKQNPASVLSPSASLPSGKFSDAINSTFTSLDNFKTKFSETAMKVFGSGWAWVVINKDLKPEIGSSPNQDNPLMDLPTGQAGTSEFKGTPVLALDIWEHAYYLKYQNKRADYIANWWNIVNWEEASRLFNGKC
jgi:Fe-Mn family superoxide dismutase